MKILTGVLALGAAAVLGLTVASAETPPAEYVKTMKDVSAAAMSLRQNGTDMASVAKDAASLKALFDWTAKFWQARKVQDAFDIATGASKAAADLEAAAKASNADGVAAATKTVTGVCTTCHNLHRDRHPDGTSDIK